MKAWKEFQKKYGEGTAADLDYGKLAILVLVIYIAIQVTWVKKLEIKSVKLYIRLRLVQLQLALL